MVLAGPFSKKFDLCMESVMSLLLVHCDTWYIFEVGTEKREEGESYEGQ